MTIKRPSNGNEERHKNEKSHDSHASHKSHQPAQPSAPPQSYSDRLLPPHGDDQSLLSFQKAETIYDLTFRFAHKYLARGDRTIDQMIQSARSGKQNILEGSKAGTTPRKPKSN